MSIRLHLPGSLSRMTRGTLLFQVDGETVGECLSHFVSLFPGSEKELFYSGTGESLATDGRLWSKVKVLVNGEIIDTDVLATRLKADDEVHIRVNTH